MNKKAIGMIVSLCGAALVVGGCAKQEIVKKDESLAPKATVTAATDKGTAKTEKIVASPVKQDTKEVAPQNVPAQKSDQGIEQLKSALEKVFFAFDSAKLSQKARQTLVKDAAVIKQNSKARIRIEGNCDERGSDEYNLALGEKRAKEAMEYLVTMGIPANRLSVISYGKEKPANPGHNEAAWAQNRRDEFVPVTP
ncbi:peptidoglycan-associated lipoprotein Pal [Geobacter argillaceus]|uniref:Peptidoglycan-associated lipoprotein n=1 Tax=Geobacter argillaceus TaxID=345631 RepID=A0A562V7Z9_9BACT|nr:peptidoglycan-associated lipoprotein Pal [Geobacter argillaceus]TWJ14019.1 peptidoglycan-associated lipoprotein [Geobacter argillaceus]